MDETTNRFATAARYDAILKKAYSDIKGEAPKRAVFSTEPRTFHYLDNEAGAASYLRFQRKFGVGDELIGMMTEHLEGVARDLAVTRIMGHNPEAFHAARMRAIADKPELPRGPGAERFNPVRLIAPSLQSNGVLNNTFKMVTGRGRQMENELLAHLGSGARSLVGMSSLRNLSITIVPGDTVMTGITAWNQGMSGFKILNEIATVDKRTAAHLQINAHAASDYINNNVRQYEDRLSLLGGIRKLQRGIVDATGASTWTTQGRMGAQTSQMNQLAEWRNLPYDKLDRNTQLWFQSYGFGPEEWDKIRSAKPFVVNGAKYYISPEGMDPKLWERLSIAVHERSAYMFHQPDARSRAIAAGSAPAGSGPGELWRSALQYKQFAIERMTTHLMRTLIDDSSNRVGRALAYTTLATAAGAVSIQAANIIAGRDAEDTRNKGFWLRAFFKGGAGGIYGDAIDAAIRGDRGTGDALAGLAGPVPGLIADAARTAVSPIKQEFDDSGRPSRGTKASELFSMAERYTPNTFYTKLAVDRLLWEKLQTLVDPNYRDSFRRKQQNLNRATGQDFWWGPGKPAPERAPAFTRQ
jgi:hypothetical protein